MELGYIKQSHLRLLLQMFPNTIQITFIFMISILSISCTLDYSISELSSKESSDTSDGGKGGPVTPSIPPNTSTSATLLKNINTNEQGSYPSDYVKMGSHYFFAANDGIHGIELWKTDGTEAGTMMVKDINVGISDSNPTSLVVYQGKLYFGISVDDSPDGLWVSDGTEVGTHSLKDFGIMRPYIYEHQPITIVNNLMFFTAYDATLTDSKLMRSDGTSAGTYVLRTDLDWVYIEGAIGNRVLFRAENAALGSEMYYSEGTEVTTLLLKDFNPGVSSGYYGMSMVIANNVGLFIANNGTGWKLWRTDGTEGGTTLYDGSIASLPTANSLGFLKSYAGNTYFMDGTNPKVNLGANPLVAFGIFTNNRIFYFAGTASGTSLFSTDGVIARNHIDLDSTTTSWSYRKMIPSSLGVFFEVKSSATGWELYFHDGSTGIPVSLGDNNLGAGNFTPTMGLDGIVLDDKLIFAGVTATSGEELWISDGTASGTTLLKDIFPGTSSSFPKKFYKDNGFVYFYADDGVHGSELWRTDGTEAGTTMLKNINLRPESSAPEEFTVIGSEIFFSANDSIHGRELWKSNGTPEGTVLVKDGVPYSESTYPTELKNLNGELVYIGADNLTYATVWKSDGTSAGTQVIKPGFFDDNGYVGGLTVLGNKAYFQGRSSAVGRELFVTDGTDAGTQNLVDLNPGAGSFFDYGLGDPDLFLNLTQGILYFVREMGSFEPWASDGTANMANNVALGNSIRYASDFFEAGNITYFNALDSNSGDYVLYKSNGTVAGTEIVINIEPGSSESVVPLSSVNSKFIFAAKNSLNGKELWATDGSTAGTQMIKEFTPGADSSDFLSASKEALGTQTFFVVSDSIVGYELWVTDGTSAGTHLLKDINPGSASSSPDDFVKIGSYVYFSAGTTAHGRELWRTDGTADGTVMVADILPGTGSSSPKQITPFGNKIIFTAEDAQGDREVHIYTPQ